MTAVIAAVLVGAAVLFTPVGVAVADTEIVRWWRAWRASQPAERALDRKFCAALVEMNRPRRVARDRAEYIRTLKNTGIQP